MKQSPLQNHLHLMKTKILIPILIALPTLALAGFKLPGKVFELADLEKAKTEAVQKGKPISILYSDKDSTCSLCSAASETIIRELASKTIMVYVRDIATLPAPAQAALQEGKYIPKVAVLNAALDHSLGLVTYEAIQADPRKAFRAVETAIRGYKK